MEYAQMEIPTPQPEHEVFEARREDRIKQTAEVFTPAALVNDMLSKLPKSVWEKGKTFCDPACGNGNFLVAILSRKIQLGHNPLDALKSIYGVDIMKDNIRECRFRLLKIVSNYQQITEEHIIAIFKNIVFLNSKKYPDGSLQYNFSFNSRPNHHNVTAWMESINSGKLSEVNLPVDEETFGNIRRIF